MLKPAAVIGTSRPGERDAPDRHGNAYTVSGCGNQGRAVLS